LPGKTIVFVEAAATVRHLLRCLRGRRVAGVVGETGLFAGGPGGRADALRAFAPRAQGAPPPAPALETDVLIATDLLSEGLNLQDAVRVIHYDLPWSPARLTQRVGRIDRAGSPHAQIETVALLPAPPRVPGPRPSTARRSGARSSAPRHSCGRASAPLKPPAGAPRIATGWPAGSFRGYSPPLDARLSGASTPSWPGSTPSCLASRSA